MAVDVLLGLQWGDEGKGKIVDYLATQYDVVARFQGGPNAGHTLKFDGKKYVLHTIPSGIFRKKLLNFIGNGVVIDPITFQKEIKNLDDAGVDYQDRIIVAKKAHLIMPTHRLLDAASEAAKGASKIGSTLRGIGPTYMDKTGRNGLRVGDIFSPSFSAKYYELRNKHLNLLRIYPPIDITDLDEKEEEWFRSLKTLRNMMVVDGEYYINDLIKNGKKILAEGAQGSMLDIDFGTYPYVTSSNTITAGVCTGLGIAPRHVGEVIGISKAYCTRVGSGPFPTELFDKDGEKLRQEGHEFGATTGRPRRCGWIDIPALKYTIMLNGVSQLVITKIDILNNFKEVKVATHYNYEGENRENIPYEIQTYDVEPIYASYEGWNTSLEGIDKFEDMPEKVKAYIHELEQILEVKITMVSTGPQRHELVVR